jgi:delta-aminolevulinic acid dehydratase/porphobilinogen synthase
MDPGNRREALREIQLDVEEGADMVMVKPALAYLDIIAEAAASVNVPVAAYQVSGEYAMIHAAGQLGWLDADAALMEATLSIKRAGADMILSYGDERIAVQGRVDQAVVLSHRISCTFPRLPAAGCEPGRYRS